ncbi:MAG: hypothetical protein M1825_005356 [Sarcosagium campestre]|nr:MAG: hypothetical protein M1825_005356 [Sarcosagium campestre]
MVVLREYDAQEGYYSRIHDRYMAYWAAAGPKFRTLESSMANLSLPQDEGLALDVGAPKLAKAWLGKKSTPTTPQCSNISDLKAELDILMLSMRKLREGIVAASRTDDFAVTVYIFCIRAAVLAKHMESYVPALLHLLHVMHVVRPLIKTTLDEFVAYLVLHLACRQRDLAGAYAARHSFGLHDASIDAMLFALVHENYHVFWRIRDSVDGYKACLMEHAEEFMREQALKSMARSYFSVELSFLRECVRLDWDELKLRHAVGWELEGGRVIIRKPRSNPGPLLIV